MYAGCAELADVGLYRNPQYYAYLWRIDWLAGVYMKGWLEQAFKTLWPLIVVPPAQWDYSCETVVQHKRHPTGPFCHENKACPLKQLLAGRSPKATRVLDNWQQ